MKATEVTTGGFYWCSHQLLNQSEVDWHVCEFLPGVNEFLLTGTEMSYVPGQFRDHVEFIGPLTPPEAK